MPAVVLYVSTPALTGDWYRDNMTTVTNIWKVLCVEGKVNLMWQIINVKMQADLHRDFGILRSKRFGKRDPKLLLCLNRPEGE